MPPRGRVAGQTSTAPLFGCGPAALWFVLSVFLRVLRVLCGLPFAAETSAATPVWLPPCRTELHAVVVGQTLLCGAGLQACG